MNNTMMTRVAGALALALGVSAGVAMAQPTRARAFGPRAFGSQMNGPLGGLLAVRPDLPLATLKLTDAQREQVRGILNGHRDETRAVAEKARAALEGLRAASAAAVDEAAVSQHSAALGEAIGEAAVLRAKVRGEVLAILTPEQQTELQRIQAAREERQKQFQERRAKRMQERRDKRQR